MKLPRNINGGELVKRLSMKGYAPAHQTGSHVKLKTVIDGKTHCGILHSFYLYQDSAYHLCA